MSQRSLLVLLLALTAVVHALALDGAFVYDDQLLIVQNAPLQRGEIWRLVSQPYFGQDYGYWRPLTSLALWLGKAIDGATGIHALALAAHLIATWFAFRIARTLLGNAPLACATALLFGLHPVQVEGVAWCSALNDPLWLACGLGCLDAVLRSRTGTAAACFALALLAKENALVLLPLSLAARWLALPTRASADAANAALPPMRSTAVALAAVGLSWFALRAFVFGSILGGLDRAPIDPVVSAHRASATITAFGRQLELLVWPWPMSPFRALASVDGQSIQGMTAGWAWTVLWVAAMAAAWLRSRREIAFALLLIAAQPTLSALRCDRLGAYPIADRYLGTSVLGFALWIAFALPARLRIAALSFLAAAICAVATLQQIPTWKNQGALLEHALQAEPNDPALQVMAGRHWLAKQDPERARTAYQRALSLVPHAQQSVVHRSEIDAHVGIGWCELQPASKPNLQAAVRAFELAIQQDAQCVDAWIGLGVAHGMAGHGTDAERALRRAIEIAPYNSSAHFNLAYLYEQQGRSDRARQAAQESLRCDPNNFDAQALLDRVK